MQLAAPILAGASVAAIATAVVLRLTGARAPLAPVVTPTGAAIIIEGSF
jgi:hypothetical protein